MKIVLLTKEYPPYNSDGGIATYMKQLAENLIDDTVFIATAIEKGSPYRLEKNIIPIFMPNRKRRIFRYAQFLYDMLFAYKAYRLIKRINADIIETHEWGFPALFLQLFGIPIPIVIRAHGSYRQILLGKLGIFHLNVSVYDFFEQYCLRHATHIIYPNTLAKKLLLQDYPSIQTQSSLIPLGIDTKRFFPVSFKRKSTFLLLFVGRIVERKNVKKLLEFFTMLYKKDSSFRLRLVGSIDPYDCSVYETYIHKHSLDAVVTFAGFVPYDKLQKEYARADAFITLSTFETFGLNAFEALACGLPVIGFEEVLPHMIRTKHFGLLLDQHAYHVEEVITFLKKHDILQNIRLTAPVYIQKHYSIESMARQERLLYKDVISSYTASHTSIDNSK